MSKKPPIYFVIRRMIDPETGEMVGALVPNSPADCDMMRERKMRANDIVRAELSLPRNEKFNRLVHALGRLCVQNIPGFERLDAHSAIKRLQSESGIECDEVLVDARPMVSVFIEAVRAVAGDLAANMVAVVLPKVSVIPHREPRSLRFDLMGDEDFRRVYEGIKQHICDVYWPTMTPEQIDKMAQIMQD